MFSPRFFVSFVLITKAVTSFPAIYNPPSIRPVTTLTNEEIKDPSPWIKFPYFGNILSNFPNLISDIAEAGPKIETDSTKFQVIINVKDYKRENIKTSIKGKFIIIQGLDKAVRVQSNLSSQFVQKYSLPENASAASVTAILTTDGYLVVNAPLSTGVIKYMSFNRDIPILAGREPLLSIEVKKNSFLAVPEMLKLSRKESAVNISELHITNQEIGALKTKSELTQNYDMEQGKSILKTEEPVQTKDSLIPIPKMLSVENTESFNIVQKTPIKLEDVNETTVVPFATNQESQINIENEKFISTTAATTDFSKIVDESGENIIFTNIPSIKSDRIDQSVEVSTVQVQNAGDFSTEKSVQFNVLPSIHLEPPKKSENNFEDAGTSSTSTSFQEPQINKENDNVIQTTLTQDNLKNDNENDKEISTFVTNIIPSLKLEITDQSYELSEQLLEVAPALNENKINISIIATENKLPEIYNESYASNSDLNNLQDIIQENVLTTPVSIEEENNQTYKNYESISIVTTLMPPQEYTTLTLESVQQNDATDVPSSQMNLQDLNNTTRVESITKLLENKEHTSTESFSFQEHNLVNKVTEVPSEVEFLLKYVEKPLHDLKENLNNITMLLELLQETEKRNESIVLDTTSTMLDTLKATDEIKEAQELPLATDPSKKNENNENNNNVSETTLQPQIINDLIITVVTRPVSADNDKTDTYNIVATTETSRDTLNQNINFTPSSESISVTSDLIIKTSEPFQQGFTNDLITTTSSPKVLTDNAENRSNTATTTETFLDDGISKEMADKIGEAENAPSTTHQTLILTTVIEPQSLQEQVTEVLANLEMK